MFKDVVPSPWVVRSDKDVHFPDPIFSGALGLDTIGEVGETDDGKTPSREVIIQRVTLLTNVNLPWDVMFFSSTFAPVLPTDADLDVTVDWVSFAAADGKQIGGAGLYRYSTSGLEIGYSNIDAPGQIHVGLVNKSAAGNYWGPKFFDYIVVEVQGVTYS